MISPHDTSPAVRVVTTCAREKGALFACRNMGGGPARRGAERAEITQKLRGSGEVKSEGGHRAAHGNNNKTGREISKTSYA